jgi:hypothetical protein
MSATVVFQARCSSRQFVNSGATGNVKAGQSWSRSSATALPARAMACANDSVVIVDLLYRFAGRLRTPSFAVHT